MTRTTSLYAVPKMHNVPLCDNIGWCLALRVSTTVIWADNLWIYRKMVCVHRYCIYVYIFMWQCRIPNIYILGIMDRLQLLFTNITTYSYLLLSYSYFCGLITQKGKREKLLFSVMKVKFWISHVLSRHSSTKLYSLF